MRRPVLYLAGLLMATGASLALAGPASAAVSHDSITSQVAHWDDDECDDDDDFSFHRHHRHHHHYFHGHRYNGNRFYGVNVLSGVFGNR